MTRIIRPGPARAGPGLDLDTDQGMALGIEMSVMARIITMVQSAVREGGQAEGKDECGIG
jgi:hypothetical protein